MDVQSSFCSLVVLLPLQFFMLPWKQHSISHLNYNHYICRFLLKMSHIYENPYNKHSIFPSCITNGSREDEIGVETNYKKKKDIGSKKRGDEEPVRCLLYYTAVKGTSLLYPVLLFHGIWISTSEKPPVYTALSSPMKPSRLSQHCTSLQSHF